MKEEITNTTTIFNFRGLEQGWIVKVLEGEGTKESIARIVYYVYSKNGKPIGKIDSMYPQQKFDN